MFKFVVQLSHSLILVTESSNMAPHGKELSGDLKRHIAALHEDGQGYKKIANTLKLSCSTGARINQRFKRTSLRDPQAEGGGVQSLKYLPAPRRHDGGVEEHSSGYL